MIKNIELANVAKQVINNEIKGLEDLREFIDSTFESVVKKIINVKGKLIFSGIGKSGYVARKISATLSSTGIPSFFIHPAEAGHGDLGMITKQDIVVLLSNSGNTFELNTILTHCKRFKIFIIGVTRKEKSILSKSADLSIILPNSREASDISIPSTSVIMMIAFWDAVTIALQKLRGFSNEDFKILHPGGKIGAGLLQISQLMHKNDFIPTVDVQSSGVDAIFEMTNKGFGCTGVVNKEKKLVGIITDGDLRRHMNMDLKKVTASYIMNNAPIVVKKDAFASQVLSIMNDNCITNVFIVQDAKPIGIVHMHDLIRAGVA